MTHDLDLEQLVAINLIEAESQITNSLHMAAQGDPLASEPDRERMIGRLKRKGAMSSDQAALVARGIEMAAIVAPMPSADTATLRGDGRAETVWGTFDFVNTSFLEKGARMARTVARVAFANGRPKGSGFMIGDGLFMTNNHVLVDPDGTSAFVLEFDFELNLAGTPRVPTRFAIDNSVFVSDPVNGLDFTIVAVGPRLSGPAVLDDFGWCGLSDAPNKHMLGEYVNIVQHPQGRFKEVVLRENQLVARLKEVLHYVADTEPGSSGSPVFNSEWEVIALHHWGGPWRQKVGLDGKPLKREINEGIRTSAIVEKLRSRLAGLNPVMRARITKALELGAEQRVFEEAVGTLDDPNKQQGGNSPQARIDGDGRVTWTIPLELSVCIPAIAQPASHAVATAAAATPVASSLVVGTAAAEDAPSMDYSDRSGFDRGFITGFNLPLPKLSADRARLAAMNKRPNQGDPVYELRYHHFSAAMNKKRKLPFFTACNIDGANAKSVNRTTKKITDLLASSAGLESTGDRESMEASETWYLDDRLDPADYAGQELYDSQKLPDFPSPRDHLAHMFQRGHLVRRLDPCWGPDALVLAAELDTFHFTNCTPQVGFFNQGTADAAIPGSGRGQFWRAVENFVLRSAVASETRVNCYSGPIFSAQDKPFRGVLIPQRFFKIVVWAENNALKSLAMIADQSAVIDARREALSEGVVTFADLAELDKVKDFLTTVARVRTLTGISFGTAVAKADIRLGQADGAAGATPVL
jgi:endonuclease G, mitochondrial